MNEDKIINGLKEIKSTANWWLTCGSIIWIINLFFVTKETYQEHKLFIFFYGFTFVAIPLFISGVTSAFLRGYKLGRP